MDLLRRFTDYLNSPQNKLSNKTVKNYKADISSFVSWYKKQYNQELGITPANITSQIVDLYKTAKIQESNLSSNSLKRHLSSLRRFFQFLKTQGIISQDPFEQMKNLLKNALIREDKWHLQAFKNYLYLYNKSSLTVKNYILDARHFLTWVEEVTKEENVFSKINHTLVSVYKKRLLEHGFSPRTINRNLSSIRQYSKFLKTTEVQLKFSNLNILKDIKWRLKGRPIFSGSSLNYAQRTSQESLISSLPRTDSVRGLPKSFYAPLAISTRYFPWYKKTLHYIHHKRPNWYKKYQSNSITHYFHVALLTLFISQLVFVINQSISPKPQNQTSVLGTLESMPRHFLSFKGKLTDSSNNPIKGSTTPVRMSIYNDETASGSSLLWQEAVSINTDSDGKFSTSLGNNAPLPQNLFVENQALWLGVSVGESPELVPREPIASTTFATNAEKLQGISPITSPNANTKNVILALDSSGNLTIDGDASPTFQSTGGTFKLLGQTLVLSTTPGTNTNVEIAPMDLGKIDLQKPLFNSTNNNNIDNAIGAVEIDDSLAVLATTSATSAFTINQTSTGPLISAYINGSAKFVLDNNGRLGIGTTLPSVKLDLQDSQSSSTIAQIFNTNTGTAANGLAIKLGNTSNSTVNDTNHFIDFKTEGIGIVGSIRGSGGNGIQYQTSGIADFAEYLKKDENQDIEYGTLVCIDEKGKVLPCDQANNKIVGVASNHGGFTAGVDLGDSSIRVGFVGQAITRVSNINGNIKPGDPLTSSSISGVAAKAVGSGEIIGKALESLDDTKILGYYDIEKKEYIDKSTLAPNILISQYPNFIPFGKILVAISVSWYDPSLYISLNQNQSNDTIISPIAEIDKVHTDIISPLASVAPTNLHAPQNEIALEIQNSSGSAVVTNDSLGIASSSGSLDAETKEKQSPNIPTFAQGLMSFGPTSLTDVSIIGQLSIGQQGGGFTISQNSINAIGAVIELQPLRQGGLSIMGGLVYIDTDGNLKVGGDAEFSKDVRVGGDLVASGSGTFSKLNLNIAKNAFALSSKELIATGSAGTAFVRAREVEITINNNLVTEKSLIYITPVGTPSGQIPFLLRQVPEEPVLSGHVVSEAEPVEGSFTVGIASPSAANTPFNWLIIN